MIKKLSNTWGAWAQVALTTQEQTHLMGGCGCIPTGPPPPPPPASTTNNDDEV